MKCALEFLMLLSVTVLIAGCKLAVIVVESGEVQSNSYGTCMAGAVCIVDVPDTDFSQAFEAVPDEGSYFHKWGSGDGFLCGGSSNPRCALFFNQLAKENSAINDLVASSETFYLMPIFKRIETDNIVVDANSGTVSVDGMEWLQPADFIGWSYDQVSEVCLKSTNRVCTGRLWDENRFQPSRDLTGFIWASSDDVRLLLHSFRKVGRAVSGSDNFRPTIAGGDVEYLTAMLSDDSTVVVIGDFGEISQSTPSELRESSPPPWFWRPLD